MDGMDLMRMTLNIYTSGFFFFYYSAAPLDWDVYIHLLFIPMNAYS
jgi:hypothetical protein